MRRSSTPNRTTSVKTAHQLQWQHAASRPRIRRINAARLHHKPHNLSPNGPPTPMAKRSLKAASSPRQCGGAPIQAAQSPFKRPKISCTKTRPQGRVFAASTQRGSTPKRNASAQVVAPIARTNRTLALKHQSPARPLYPQEASAASGSRSICNRRAACIANLRISLFRRAAASLSSGAIRTISAS